MTVGKNLGLSKGAKKGSKKLSINPFTRKDWYDVKSPSNFKVRQIGKTLINRTQNPGKQTASEGLKGRVFDVSLSDLQMDNVAERSFRKFKLVAEDVVGGNVLTSFHGMNLSNDKLRRIVRKWQTLIEAAVVARTTDGYLLRVFCIGYTHNENPWTKRKTCYVTHAKVKAIRRMMGKMISKEISANDLNEVVNRLIPDSIGKDIAKASHGIFPLHDVYIRKVKILRKPTPDLSRLLEMHSNENKVKAVAPEDHGEVVHKPDGYEPPIQNKV